VQVVVLQRLSVGLAIALHSCVLVRSPGFLLILIVVLAASSRAQSGRMTLDEALDLAGAHHPQLQAATAQLEGAAAGIVTARAYPNPEFNTTSGPQYARRNPVGQAAPGLLLGYGVSQQLELRGLRQARIELAQRGRDSGALVVDEVRLSVRGAVKQAFYEVLRRRAEVELARDNLRLIEDLRRRIEVQVDVGEAARLELVRAEAEVATARNLARSAQLRLVTSTSTLRAAIAAPLAGAIEPVGTLDPPQVLPPLEQLRDEVLARHPALARMRAEIRRAEASLRNETAQRVPQPSLFAEYDRQPDLGYFRAGISIPIPVLNRREGPIAEAVAQLRRARAENEMREIELTAALERAYGQYEVASQQLAAFQEGVLREAEAALAAAEAAFRFGERGIIEVLDAQRVLRSVRSDLVSAQFDLQAARIDLEQLRASDLGTTP
jgi:outer membrane protein, heavy metal efflux system